MENAGPIGLLLMVVLSESYLQHLECKAIAEVLTIEIQPKNIKTIYRRQSCFLSIKKNKTNTFQEILKKQDPAFQYTIKNENEKKCLNFLDITITSTINNKYEFKIHHQKASHYQYTYQSNVMHQP